MPDTPNNEPVVQDQVVTSTETSQALTPQQESREDVYRRLYENNAPAAQPTTSVAQQPTAQEPDYKELFNQLSSQVQQLLAAQAAPTGSAATVPTIPQEDWFALLQAGKRTEAEKRLEDQMVTGAGQKIIQEAISRVTEINRMEREINDFNTQVRAQNADMLDVEELIANKAEKDFAMLQAAGKIQNSKDYVDGYKKVVSGAVDHVRNIMRRTRAAAKNEAMTTRRDVLASTVMTPNDIQRREDQGQGNAQPTEPQVQSPTDYLAARKANYRQIAGISS